MSSARDRIMARIAEARGGSMPDAAAIAAERAAIHADEGATQPPIQEQDTIARFKAMASSERLTATVDEVAALEDVPQAVAAYLARENLAGEVSISPALAGLDWSGVQTITEIGANQPIAVTLAEGGVAETGSLVFRSGADTPMLHNFLALYHVAVVRKEQVGRYLESVFAPGSLEMPRILSLITGTSGTADIEAVNIRGAHGPRYLHIVLVG